MTRVVVESGICGFITTVEVTKVTEYKIRIVLISDCKAINKLNEQYRELEWTKMYKDQDNFSPYKLIKCLSHIACPVPVAILKALEVEIGVALPKDVAIRFES